MSILSDTKRVLKGIDPECTDFDDELIIYINSNLRILNRLGVGDPEVEVIDNTTTWEDFLGEDIKLLSEAKSWMGLKTGLVFDPPTNSIVRDSIEHQIEEYEWDLKIAAEFRN